MTEKHFHAEVVTANLAGSDQRAEELARQQAKYINSIEGTLVVVRMHGDRPAILACTFPDDTVVDAGWLSKIFGLSFREVHARTVGAVNDYGIPGD